MSYPSLINDIKWLRFQAEFTAKLSLKIGGDSDVFRIANGDMIFFVNVSAVGDVFGYYMKTQVATELSLEKLIDHIAERIVQSRNR